MNKLKKRTGIEYSTYIKSRSWFDKHPDWLKTVGYRCTMFPWVRVGKGHRYAVHHMHYRNLGNEQLGTDVIPLCPFAHNYIIHGILAGFKSAGKQQSYPNAPQRLIHFWCVQRLWFKGVLVLLLLWKLSKIF